MINLEKFLMILPKILSRLFSSIVAESKKKLHLNAARKNFHVSEQYGRISHQPLSGSITLRNFNNKQEQAVPHLLVIKKIN